MNKKNYTHLPQEESTDKSVWTKPELEILSRDIVKTGTVPGGVESAPTASALQNYSS